MFLLQVIADGSAPIMCMMILGCCEGWILQQGGIITRVQVGEPDDQEAYEDTLRPDAIEDLTKYPAGYLYTRDSSGRFACPLMESQSFCWNGFLIIFAWSKTLQIISYQGS